MSERWAFDRARLKIDNKGDIDCKVTFTVDVYDPESDELESDFIKGVRLLGELTVDVWFNEPRIKARNPVGELTVCDEEYREDTTKFKVVLLDLKEVQKVVPNKHTRHVWTFAFLDHMHDKIGVFPPPVERLKMFIVSDFVGYFNIPGHGLVVATDGESAKSQFDRALVNQGLAMSSFAGYSLTEVNPRHLDEKMLAMGLSGCQKRFDMTEPMAIILSDGSE